MLTNNCPTCDKKIDRRSKTCHRHVAIHFQKGNIPWNKGMAWNKEARDKMSKSRVGRFADDNHPGWRGDKVGYSGIHKWITRKLGKPSKCEDCGSETANKYEWANISGEYKRDISDWKRLCRHCHHKFDDLTNKAWVTRKGKEKVTI